MEKVKKTQSEQKADLVKSLCDQICDYTAEADTALEIIGGMLYGVLREDVNYKSAVLYTSLMAIELIENYHEKFKK